MRIKWRYQKEYSLLKLGISIITFTHLVFQIHQKIQSPMLISHVIHTLKKNNQTRQWQSAVRRPKQNGAPQTKSVAWKLWQKWHTRIPIWFTRHIVRGVLLWTSAQTWRKTSSTATAQTETSVIWVAVKEICATRVPVLWSALPLCSHAQYLQCFVCDRTRRESWTM